MTYLQDWQNYI